MKQGNKVTVAPPFLLIDKEIFDAGGHLLAKCWRDDVAEVLLSLLNSQPSLLAACKLAIPLIVGECLSYNVFPPTDELTISLASEMKKCDKALQAAVTKATTRNHPSIDDIERLAKKIKDNWSLCEFLGMTEAEVLVAQTIHACVINHKKHGKPFSFRGGGLGTSGHGLFNYGGAYNRLLDDKLIIEDKWKDKVIIWPTQLLIDKLDDFFAK